MYVTKNTSKNTQIWSAHALCNVVGHYMYVYIDASVVPPLSLWCSSSSSCCILCRRRCRAEHSRWRSSTSSLRMCRRVTSQLHDRVVNRNHALSTTSCLRKRRHRQNRVLVTCVKLSLLDRLKLILATCKKRSLGRILAQLIRGWTTFGTHPDLVDANPGEYAFESVSVNSVFPSPVNHRHEFHCVQCYPN